MPPTAPRTALRVMICSKNVSCIIVVLPSFQPVGNQEKGDRPDQAHYGTPPAGLSTHQAANHGNEPDALRHIVEKLGGALSLPIAHIPLETAARKRLLAKIQIGLPCPGWIQHYPFMS